MLPSCSSCMMNGNMDMDFLVSKMTVRKGRMFAPCYAMTAVMWHSSIRPWGQSLCQWGTWATLQRSTTVGKKLFLW